MGSALEIILIICGINSCFSNNIKLGDSPKNTKFYDGDHDYGYVEVRKGAFMFWWLYYAGGDENTAYEKPLIIWIQGGPAIPASGVGNFLELGPQDMDLNNRTYSWVHKRNVLFFDSPVGSGFSYVTNSSLLVKTDNKLARDLVTLIRKFLNKFPNFKTVPTHIFSQSYGGKIAPRLAYFLHKKIKAGKIEMNLKTVGLGSAYVSPKHYVLAYSDYLYNLGFIDRSKRDHIEEQSNEIAKMTDRKQYTHATSLNHQLFGEIHYLNYDSMSFDHFNIYNVLKIPSTNPEAMEHILSDTVDSIL